MGIAVAIHRETGIGMKNALKIVALYHGSKMLTLELMNQTRKD